MAKIGIELDRRSVAEEGIVEETWFLMFHGKVDYLRNNFRITIAHCIIMVLNGKVGGNIKHMLS